MGKEDAQNRIQRGVRTRGLLENDAFIEAVADVEAKLINGWQNTKATQAEAREILYWQLNGLRLVMSQLHGAVKVERLERQKIEMAALEEAKKSPQIVPID